jgi:N6-adenosine-specific RNA methylase IME4
MTNAEIAALPVDGLAAIDSHLYLWTIQRHLCAAFGIVRAWGFNPSCVLTWCKPRGGFVGGTFFSNAEFILFCRRGSLAAKQRVNSQWFEWSRGEHSAKPDAFIDMVEQVSPAPIWSYSPGVPGSVGTTGATNPSAPRRWPDDRPASDRSRAR